MAKRKPREIDDTGPSPAMRTLEGRESQMIALAYDLVEQRLRDGTATSQETTHFLKLGSTKERRELKLLEAQIAVAESKVEAYKSSKNIEELIAEALDAKRSYQSSQTSAISVSDGDIHG